jgi:hypothetical protein
MNGNKLYKERILPCLNELYATSECIDCGTYTWDMLFEYAQLEKNSDKKEIPTGAFYISKEKYDEIIAKYSKGLPYYWRFPYRSEIYPKGEDWEQLQLRYKNNPNDEELKKEYEDTIEYMRRDKLWDEYYSRLSDIDERRNKKEIDGKTAKKLRDALAKEFNCQRRSNERESISFTAAFWGPTYIRDYFEKVKLYYEGRKPEGTDHSLAKHDAEVFKGFEKNIRNAAECGVK